MNKERISWDQFKHNYFEEYTSWLSNLSNLSGRNIFTFQLLNILASRHYDVSDSIRLRVSEDFDARKYKLFHQGFIGMSNAHAMKHWVSNGQFEDRPY